MTPDPSHDVRAFEPGLSIVIPSWNGRPLLERFLPSVVRAAAVFESTCRQPAEIIVADDASDDGTDAWLAANFPPVRRERGGEHAGFAPTANRGVRAARYALVYILNNDVALEPETLPPLVAHFTSASVFAVASQVYDYHTGQLRGAGQLGEFRRGFLGIHRRYFVPESAPSADRPWLTFFATGGSALFDLRKFLALGGFEERFAPFGWEDVELSLRAWKQGFEVHWEPRSRVWHQFSSTITPGFSRRYVRAVYERNRLWAHWLHLDTPGEAAAHATFLALKHLAATFAGQWEMWSATAQALSRWGEIRAQRERLRSGQRRSLREILAQIAGELCRPHARPLNESSAPVRPFRPFEPDE